MNLKEARKLQSGAIVREAYFPDDALNCARHALVIGKTHVVQTHHAKVLSQIKEERYDVVIHWLCEEKLVPREYIGLTATKKPLSRVQVRENWELMVVSHAGS